MAVKSQDSPCKTLSNKEKEEVLQGEKRKKGAQTATQAAFDEWDLTDNPDNVRNQEGARVPDVPPSLTYWLSELERGVAEGWLEPDLRDQLRRYLIHGYISVEQLAYTVRHLSEVFDPNFVIDHICKMEQFQGKCVAIHSLPPMPDSLANFIGAPTH